MLQGFFLNGIGWIDLAGKRQRYSAEISDTKSIYCNKDGWQIEVRNYFKRLEDTNFHFFSKMFDYLSNFRVVLYPDSEFRRLTAMMQILKFPIRNAKAQIFSLKCTSSSSISSGTYFLSLTIVISPFVYILQS